MHLLDGTAIPRRSLLVGLAAFGSALFASAAHAFPRGALLAFRYASRLLAPFGIQIFGDSRSGHDTVSFEIVPLDATEYLQSVLEPKDDGSYGPSIETSVFGADASFTHFHPRQIIPCVRTKISGHSLAEHELLDVDQGGAIPCVKVASEMLEGGHIGDVEFLHLHPIGDGLAIPCVKTTIESHARAVHELFDAGDIVPCIKVASEMLEGGRLGAIEMDVDPNETLTIRVGERTYRLLEGELVPDDGLGPR